MAESMSPDEQIEGSMSPAVKEYLERCLIELETCDKTDVDLDAAMKVEIEALEENRPQKCSCLQFEPVFILSYTINGADCPPVTQWQCYRCAACALLQMPHIITLRHMRFYAR